MNEIVESGGKLHLRLTAASQAEKDDVDALLAQIEAKRAQLQAALDNWASLSAGQKDELLKALTQIEVRALRAWVRVLRRVGD
jgi:hypothetical protein